MSPFLDVPVAFLLGGTIISLLSFLAEKSPRSLRGVIISFPSTMAVSFLCISYSLGPHAVGQSLPGVHIALIGAILFAFVFAVLAQRFSAYTPEQLWPVPLTLLLAGACWLVVPVAFRAVSQQYSIEVWLSLPALLFVIVASQPLFRAYADSFPLCKTPPQTKLAELCFRAVFAGSVVALGVYLAKTQGPFWGAIVGGTFPGSFSSQLMIFQAKYPAKYLPSLIKTIPYGVLSTTVYASVIALSYPQWGMIWGTLAALAASFLTSLCVGYIVRERSS